MAWILWVCRNPSLVIRACANCQTGALVSGAGITADSLNSQDIEKQGTKQLLTDDEILGNSFVFILAGHETAANTLHFSMLYLAMNWSSQARLQKDLDEIFGDRPVSAWDYDHDVPKLFESMAGAVMNEELRLIPPVIGIPKCTAKTSPQPMTVNGKRIVVPADSHVTLSTAAVHRNPRYWPTMCGPSASDAEIERDLDSFKPERWLLDSSAANHHHHGTADSSSSSSQHSDTEHDHDHDNEDFGGPGGRDTAATLFRPPRGAYIPFSEGARGCLGRRFAQIEVLAVLAVIFREYSVELAVDSDSDSDSDGTASGDREEDPVAAMNEAQRREVWGKARSHAEDLLKTGMGTIITLQMRKGKIPMRFVKRGGERFRFG